MFLRSHMKCMEGKFCSLFAVLSNPNWNFQRMFCLLRGFWNDLHFTSYTRGKLYAIFCYNRRLSQFNEVVLTLKVLGCFIPGRLDFHIQSILLRFCSKCSTFLILKYNSIWISNKTFAFALIFSCYSYLLKF